MSNGIAQVQKQISDVPDPLSAFRGMPAISTAVPQAYYVGRLIVELWEQPDISDAAGIALQIDPANGDSTALLHRIAAALPPRLSGLPTSS